MIMFALGWTCGISLLLLGQYLSRRVQELQKKHSPSYIFRCEPGEIIKSFNEGVKEYERSNKS